MERTVGKRLSRESCAAGLCWVLVLVAGTMVGAAPAAARRRTFDALGFRLAWTQVLPDPGNNITESSPIVASLDGRGPSVVVGDQAGNLWAFHLDNGTSVRGWPAHTGVPIQSTPSAATLPGERYDTVFVGGGSDAAPYQTYGYYAFTHSGRLRWAQSAPDPTGHDNGVTAGVTVYGGPRRRQVVAGTTGQTMYDLWAASGAVRWSYLTADSVHSTAAIADLGGQTRIVQGGDSTYNPAEIDGQYYANGGHVRIMTLGGSLVCQLEPQPDQTVDSSPAVGVLAGTQPSIVVGTGTVYPGAQDTNAVLSVGAGCNLQWHAQLNGSTLSSPALADVTGSPHRLQVVEPTSSGPTENGWVYVLNGSGRSVAHWPQPATAPIWGFGGAATADLSGRGYQDVVVPTLSGADVFDGRSGRLLSVLGRGQVGLQTTPLITKDGRGSIGITLAGYTATTQNCPPGESVCLQGIIEHYRVTSRRAQIGPPSESWPMFHHDARLSGSTAG